MNGWQAQLLSLLGIPVTQSNVNWITNWFNAEEPNGGFGPGYYSYYQNNPINIKVNGQFANWPDPTTGLTNTAQWLQNNGNWGGIGSYADNIKNFLMGQPNNLPSSLAWYSGHSGDASQLTTSYQNLLGSQGTTNTGTSTTQSQTQTTGTNTNQNLAQNFLQNNPLSGAWGILYNIFGAPKSLDELVSGIASDALLIFVAITLLLIGAIWMIFGNEDTKKIFIDSAKDALV